jgi:quercetin dioxygenase-like cupin family protein
MAEIFKRSSEGSWTDTGPGNRRRVILHTDELMMVEFAFEKGAVGALHAHPHVQASYVVEGRFEVTVGDSTAVLSAGDSFIVPSNTIHGARALESGRLIDSFTPHRADFLAG